jgi:hypothetical protein
VAKAFHRAWVEPAIGVATIADHAMRP